MPQDDTTPDATPNTDDTVCRLVALSLHTKACRDAPRLSRVTVWQTGHNVVVTHPTYPGTGSPAQDIADLIAGHGVCLMLDDTTEPGPTDDVASE